MKKKVLAIALAVVLVLGMSSAFASACAGGFNWTATSKASNCGQGKIEVVPFVKTNDGCGNAVWQISTCAAAIKTEKVYYAIKLTVEPKADMEWWNLAKIDVEHTGLTTPSGATNYTKKTPANFDPNNEIDFTEDKDTIEYYLKWGWGWEEVEDWADLAFSDSAATSGQGQYIFNATVTDPAKAKVCAKLTSETPTKVAGYISSRLIGNYIVASSGLDRNGNGSIYVYATDNSGNIKRFVTATHSAGELVAYTITGEKVTGIDWNDTCGQDDINTIQAYFGLYLGTPVTQDAIEENFGWDDESKSCFQWSKNGTAIVDAQCVVEIPKTGDVSVIAYAVMALVAAAGAMGLKK